MEYKKKYYEANREHIVERAKKNREEKPNYMKKYYEANREILNEKRKQYREANREKFAEKDRKYHKENPQVLIKHQLKKKFGVNPPDAIVQLKVELNKLKREIQK